MMYQHMVLSHYIVTWHGFQKVALLLDVSIEVSYIIGRPLESESGGVGHFWLESESLSKFLLESEPESGKKIFLESESRSKP